MKNSKIQRSGIIILIAILMAGCMAGPNFQKSEVSTPEHFRALTDATDTSELPDWKTIFTDTILVRLIDSALMKNPNAQMALSRVNESRAYLGMARADLYPSLTLGGAAMYGNTLGSFPTGNTAASFTVAGNINWEIAFWGKYRRANEAALAELTAGEYGLQALQLSLIAGVAEAYYNLLDYKERLIISKRTLETRTEFLRIIGERFDKGIVPEIDLNQAQMQEAYAASSIPVYNRSIAFAENALSVLIGELPQELNTTYTLEDLAYPGNIPVGIPSQLLERRPDILEAEQLLKAQNARIGVAQALRFPSISLTGLFGMASADLEAFNAGDALIGSAGASLFGPIFQFGKNKRRVDIEKERTQQMQYNYEKVVLSAFQETEDALIAIKTLKEEKQFVEIQLKASANASKLSKQRYDGGISSYLEVLEAERTLFDIELYYSDLQKRILTSYASLYKSLGGGWTNDVKQE